jgi:hypothetical protein
MTGCFRHAADRPQTRQNNFTVRILHRNVEAGADRIFIQRDATGRPAAEYPVSLINR